MIIYYVKPGCPYCAMVREKLNELGLEYEEKDVFEDKKAGVELVEKCGKPMTPCIHDTKSGVMMNESTEIIDYIESNYRNNNSN